MIARRKKSRKQKKPISPEERERRRRQREAALQAIPRLLYTRPITAHVLCCSVAKVQRLEAAGRLTPIKLTDSPSAQTHYAAAQVHALAGVGVDEAAS